MPIITNKVCRSTLENYTTSIANHAGTSLVAKATSKTNYRVATERCEKRLACHLGMMCSTHFFNIPQEDPEICRELAGLSEDCCFCYDVTTKARGTAVYPVKPHNLWNVDDTGFWHCVGVSQLSEKLKITLKDSLHTKGTDSIWIYDNEFSDFKGA